MMSEITYFDVIALVEELREENKKLSARIVELEQAQRWIPVSERLPDTKILYDHFDAVIEFESIDGGGIERMVRLLAWDYRNKTWNEDLGEFGFYPIDGVTHWRERPIPPEVQE